MATAPASPTVSSTRSALLVGLGVVLALAATGWMLARQRAAEPPQVLERFVGRWTPDWERMAGQAGTLGAVSRGDADGPGVARVVKTWKRKRIELVVHRGGEVLVVASAEPGSPPVSRHAATVEGDQLRLSGIESGGRPMAGSHVSVLRLRRDGVLLWIPLFDRSNERTILLRRP